MIHHRLPFKIFVFTVFDSQSKQLMAPFSEKYIGVWDLIANQT
jgi:hypothetical protein